ncbi:MAG: hypothetical protein AB1485_07990 [Candidatus Thermoplasmatota archaeon]
MVHKKKYPKWIIVVPPRQVKKLRWEEGQTLKGEVRRGMLIIRPITGEEKMEKSKMSYEEFSRRVEKQLKGNLKGLTWTEIKKREKFYQKVPNNKWVRQMEKDIGLVREEMAGKIIWRVKKRGV